MKIWQLTLPKNDFFAELSRDNCNLLYCVPRHVAPTRPHPPMHGMGGYPPVETRGPAQGLAMVDVDTPPPHDPHVLAMVGVDFY